MSPQHDSASPMKQLPSILVLSLLLGVVLARQAAAHKGPPFPLIEDRRVGPYVVDIWTDPDIGTGRFFVVLAPPKGQAEVPRPTQVRVIVEPVSGRLAPAEHTAERTKSNKGYRYLAAVPFDQGEWWNVAISIGWPGGGETLSAKVEVTPDGQIGPVGVVVFALPFFIVGFLWFKAARRQRQLRRAPVLEECL
jgi:hypothetical protein